MGRMKDAAQALRAQEWPKKEEGQGTESAVVTVPSLIRIAFKIIVCFQRHDVPLIFILYR
jgi:hypothetical protein